MLDWNWLSVVFDHLLVYREEPPLFANDGPGALSLQVDERVFGDVVAGSWVLQVRGPVVVHHALAPPRGKAAGLKRAGHLLEHHLALGNLLLLTGASIEVERQPLHRTALLVPRISRLLSRYLVAVRDGTRPIIVKAKESLMIVAYLASPSVLPAKADLRRLPEIGFEDICASCQLLQVVRVRAHGLGGAAEDFCGASVH